MPGLDLLMQMKDLISGSLSPEEQASVPRDFAALGSIKEEDAQGKDFRTQLYETLNSKNDLLASHKQDILQKMSSDQPMSKSQVAAMMLIGVLPTLVGGLVNGKKGISTGAQAGALGTTAMARGIEADQTRNDVLGLNQLKNVDDQLSSNDELMNKSMLDQANNADSAEQKDMDRANAQTVAGIRASGEVNAAKTLSNAQKEIAIDKDQRELNALKNPFVVNGQVLTPSQSLRTKDVDEVRDQMAEYAVLGKHLQNIAEIQSRMGSDAQGVIGATSDELDKARTLAMASLQKLKRVPGALGTEPLKKLETVIGSPSKLSSYIASYFPTNADLRTSTEITQKLLANDMQAYLQGKGGITSTPLGTKIYKDGTPYYLVGVDEATGKKDFRSDPNEVSQMLSAWGIKAPDLGK